MAGRGLTLSTSSGDCKSAVHAGEHPVCGGVFRSRWQPLPLGGAGGGDSLALELAVVLAVRSSKSLQVGFDRWMQSKS